MFALPKHLRDKTASKSTTSLQNLSHQIQASKRSNNRESYNSFEYEDISFKDDLNKSNSTIDLLSPFTRRSKPTDILARESDVIISTQIAPLTEYKGFTLYIITGIFHIVWLLWTFLPKTVLNYIGVYYYPSRWWSLSLSTFILVLMLYIYIALQLWNIEYETVKTNDLRTIIDDDAAIEKNWKEYGWKITNGVYDLRITDVNKILYD